MAEDYTTLMTASISNGNLVLGSSNFQFSRDSMIIYLTPSTNCCTIESMS